MGARLRIFLKPEEDRTLFEMRRATTVPQRVKDRAEVVRLNAQGWYVENIAHYFNWHPLPGARDDTSVGNEGTRRAVGRVRAWRQSSLASRRHRVLGKVSATRESHLQQSATGRKTGSRAASQVESRPPATGTQKKGVLWKRSRVSHRDKQDPKQRAIKQADLEMLEESGCRR
jgi:hypothetical protein